MKRARNNFGDAKSIVEEIRADHTSIMKQLEELIESRELKSTRLCRLLALIGAHHLAEEETIYASLKSELPRNVGQAVAFHAVLDDMVHNLHKSDIADGAAQYELLLLHHLLRLHFDDEEADLLEYYLAQSAMDCQFRLGRVYRASFDLALEQLCWDDKPNTGSRPVDMLK